MRCQFLKKAFPGVEGYLSTGQVYDSGHRMSEAEQLKIRPAVSAKATESFAQSGHSLYLAV